MHQNEDGISKTPQIVNFFVVYSFQQKIFSGIAKHLNIFLWLFLSGQANERYFFPSKYTTLTPIQQSFLQIIVK